MSVCPCGLGPSYEECCGKYHQGATAPTAELLMRSRYAAYARRDAPYLSKTWHPATRPATIGFDPGLTWTGLEIVGRTDGSLFHAQGTVEFRAHYRHGGKAQVMHENSSFVREDGAWFYYGPV